jgi:3,4-dihydroxy 2-butanone 4-phosphate synthase/GTP cyclohydrolase II
MSSSSQVPPVDLNEIAARNGMSRAEVEQFMTIVKNGMLPEAKIIPVTENGERRYFTVERRGVGPITTAYGIFWMFDFTIDDQWRKYTVIVKSHLDDKTFTPIFDDPTRLILRTDSGCETGQMFGDLTCECGDQLRLAMEAIGQAGEGMIVNIPHQDGRGMGLSFKLGTLWLQEALGVHTVESASMLAPGGVIDVRTYSGVVAVLRYFGIPESCEINLATNNSKKAKIFIENGYGLNDQFTPIVAEPTEYTRAHLNAKERFLGHNLGDGGDHNLIP